MSMNESRPASMSSFWMPFTNNRDFKAHPRLLVSAQGMYYKDVDGNSILDGTAGLWCVPCGHAQAKIVAAVREMVGQLDFAPTFQMGHPAAFDLAEKLMEYTNHRFGQVFYTNSGSEAVDTALKIALAYHKARGEASRTRLIGRERGYHGVGFGGISVGGIAGNRKPYGVMLPGVDHLPHTHNLEKNAYTRGEPEYGTELADELERIVALHDASTIAAVIVEPVAELLRVKMLAGLTTSEINERAVFHAITARPYKRMVDKLIGQLEAGRERTIDSLASVGMTPIARPRGGMFVSAGWPGTPGADWNGKLIADQALKSGILLSPCDFFLLRAPESIWFRFNVAYADHPQLLTFLRQLCRP
jgi:hypothetical protein